MSKTYEVFIKLVNQQYFKFALIISGYEHSCTLPIAELLKKGYSHEEIKDGLKISYTMNGKNIEIFQKK